MWQICMKSVCTAFLFVGVIRPAIAADTLQHPIVTILNVDETIPAGVEKKLQQSLTGNDASKGCSYFELMGIARQTAGSIGANLIKINSRRNRTREQFCDEVNLTYYHTDDIQAAEKRFSWSKDRKLTWADFKGPVPARAATRTAAETSAGMGVETNTVTSDNAPKVYVFNAFETMTSWVRPDHNTMDVLEHEQGHFDICELYTRKMRQRFARANLTVKNLQSVVGEVFQSVQREHAERQQQYEDETSHGIITEAQKRWTELIRKELLASEEWSS